MSESISSDNAIKIFVRDHIQPFLKTAGFSKIGMNFYRQRGDIVDNINIQGSSHNGWGNSMFFVNYGMDSHKFRETIGQPLDLKKRRNSLYSHRLHEGPDSRQNIVLMEQGRVVNFEQFSMVFLDDLQHVLDELASITTTEQLMDLVVAKNNLWEYESICAYLASTHDTSRIKTYLEGLQVLVGTDDRWPMFSNKIAQIIGDYANDPDVKQHLG